MGAAKSHRLETGKPKIMTVAEIRQAYPDEWVVMEITRDAKDTERVRGRLIAHGRDRADIEEPFLRFCADHPQTRVYRFFTGEIVPEGVVVIL
jgi:hypothetical protein